MAVGFCFKNGYIDKNTYPYQLSDVSAISARFTALFGSLNTPYPVAPESNNGKFF